MKLVLNKLKKKLENSRSAKSQKVLSPGTLDILLSKDFFSSLGESKTPATSEVELTVTLASV